MRRLLRLLLVPVVALVVLVGGDVSPVSATTDCASTWGYGDRVCVDPTTGYGPVVYIYTPGNNLWGTFPFSPQGWDCVDTAIGHGSWFGVGTAGAIGACNTAGGYSHSASVGNFTGPGAVAFTNNGTYDSWMVWFGNAGSYPSMEFITVQ